MTADFRALCAELTEKLDEFDRLLHGAQYVENPLTYRARAALAVSEPPLAPGEIDLAERARAIIAHWDNRPGSPDHLTKPTSGGD